MKFAVIYRPNGQSAAHKDLAEWFDSEEAARQRAEKILRDQCAKSVAIVQTVAMASTHIEWVTR